MKEKKERKFESNSKNSTVILEKSKQKIIEIDLNSDIQKQLNSENDINKKRKIILEYILNNLRGKYPTSDGRIVAIERLGAKKIIRGNETKIKVLPELEKLIKASEFKNIINIEHRHFKQMAYYDVSFKIQETDYRATLNIGIRENRDATLYDLNPFNKK